MKERCCRVGSWRYIFGMKLSDSRRVEFITVLGRVDQKRKSPFYPLNSWPSPSFLPEQQNRPNWLLEVSKPVKWPPRAGLKVVSSELAPHRCHAAYMMWHRPTCQLPRHKYTPPPPSAPICFHQKKNHGDARAVLHPPPFVLSQTLAIL